MKRSILACGLVAAVVAVTGCGLVADKDRIVIAEIGGTEITRGDLRMAIRRLPAEEKPSIRTRADVRNALNDYLDRELKRREAARLQNEGKISVSMEQAEAQYFRENPDIPDVRGLTDPSQLPVATTQAQLEGIKQTINEGIEAKRQELLQNQALIYLIEEAVTSNKYDIADEEWEREFAIQKEQLVHPAQATVKGAFVPATFQEAPAVAASIRERLAKGDALEAILEDVGNRQGVQPIESTLTHDPSATFLQSFWQEVEGATEGDIVGPVLIESRQVMVPDSQGGAQPRQTPPTFLVAEILGLVEAKQKTLEEANADRDLAPALLYVKVMEDLRDQYNIKIYEDNLPDPAIASDPTGPAGPVAQPDQQQQQPLPQP